MLTEEQKKVLMDWVEDQDVDPSDLSSYHYDKDPYGVGPELRGWSGEYVWDEDEEFEAKCENAIDYLESDGWEAYFDYDEDTQDPAELTKEAIEIVKGI